MLLEFETLYRLGYRGHVDFVDDNLIGNKKAVKAFLPELKAWLEQHEYPFEFTTEASLNLADDPDLMKLMSETNFIGVFCGHQKPRYRHADSDAEKVASRSRLEELGSAAPARLVAKRHFREPCPSDLAGTPRRQSRRARDQGPA
jgi:radical SAM superfamily enzyme YgiQ (UPF0313 family)